MLGRRGARRWMRRTRGAVRHFRRGATRAAGTAGGALVPRPGRGRQRAAVRRAGGSTSRERSAPPRRPPRAGAWLALLAVPRLRGEQVVEAVQATAARGGRSRRWASCSVPNWRSSRAPRRSSARVVRCTRWSPRRCTWWASGRDAYPAVLGERLGSGIRPPVLFGRGDLSLLSLQAVAVVGCRAASEYGLDVAEELGDAVARAGGCVVSGLALGIDTAAHAAALDAGGATIGVLGCGVDVFYPRREHGSCRSASPATACCCPSTCRASRRASYRFPLSEPDHRRPERAPSSSWRPARRAARSALQSTHGPWAWTCYVRCPTPWIGQGAPRAS
jgi:hypothetical protein